MRPSDRKFDELRAISFERHINKYAEGSCLVKYGDTHVLCTASLEERVPAWLRGSGRGGWISAEYNMLPRATNSRMRREATVGKQSGRTLEIQRLIGRSLRSVVDLKGLKEMQILIDCDVLQADGGTRTACISGAWVALYDCLTHMQERQMLSRDKVLLDQVVGVSCGIYKDQAILDLDYSEDSVAQADANFVLASSGRIVEVQSTGEERPFCKEEFLELLDLAQKGGAELLKLQKQAVSSEVTVD